MQIQNKGASNSGKNNHFRDQVKNSLSHYCLTPSIIQINDLRERDYIVAYLILSVDEGFETKQQHVSYNNVEPRALSEQRIGLLKKMVFIHRSAIDSD